MSTDFVMKFSQDNTNTNPNAQQYDFGTGISYERVKNKPKINGVTVEGDKSLSDYGIPDNDYEPLRNKPMIEGRTLEGDKTFQQLGMEPATVQEVEAILYLG